MRPRERYSLYGPEQFQDDELLALALGLGTRDRSAIEIARALLTEFGDLRSALESTVDGLCRVEGVGPARAVQLHASLVAGQRAARARSPREPFLKDTNSAWDHFRPHLDGLLVEEFHAVYLDRRNRLIAHRALTRGTADFTVIDPRQVFREALRCDASAVLVAHNHPSGDPSPSEADRLVTRRLATAGRIVGVGLMDHLILAGEAHFSMAQEGLIPGLEWGGYGVAGVLDF